MITKKSAINIIDNYDVTEITVTSGNNGYPSNLRTALLVNSWEDAQAIADAYPGVRIASLRRRDGWSLWEDRGSMWQPYDMHSRYCNDGRVIKTKDDVISIFSLDDSDFIRELDTNTLADYLNTASKLLRKIDDLADDEYICNYDTDDIDNYYSWRTTEKYAIGYRDDVWLYAIAITFDGISDDEEEQE